MDNASDNHIYEICIERLELHIDYINSIIDNNEEFTFLKYDRMMRDFEFIEKLYVDQKINDYCVYLLKTLKERDFHKIYENVLMKHERKSKLKKIKQLNDSKN